MLTGTAALAALGTKFRGRDEVELIWRGRERLGGLVQRAAGLLVDRRRQGVDQGGSDREHRLRFTGPGHLDLEILLLADPRPPLLPPVRVQFGGLAVETDSLRAVCALILDRLVRKPEIEDLFRLELCLRAGADIEESVNDLRVLPPAVDALDLVWALRAVEQRVGRPRRLGLRPPRAGLAPRPFGLRLAAERRLLDLA